MQLDIDELNAASQLPLCIIHSSGGGGDQWGERARLSTVRSDLPDQNPIRSPDTRRPRRAPRPEYGSTAQGKTHSFFTTTTKLRTQQQLSHSSSQNFFRGPLNSRPTFFPPPLSEGDE